MTATLTRPTPARNPKVKAAPKPRTPPSPSYLALIERHPLRPIRDDADYDRAASILEEVDFREELGGPPMDAGESDYADAMAILIRAFDDEHHPRPSPSTLPLAGRVRAVMEQAGLNQRQLADAAGASPGNVCDVLAGRRTLSKANILKLAERFNLPAEYFM